MSEGLQLYLAALAIIIIMTLLALWTIEGTAVLFAGLVLSATSMAAAAIISYDKGRNS